MNTGDMGAFGAPRKVLEGTMSIKMMTLAATATVALGLLTPMTASAQRGGGNAPNGSYVQSCSNAYVNGGRLYAQCRDIRRHPFAHEQDHGEAEDDQHQRHVEGKCQRTIHLTRSVVGRAARRDSILKGC